MMSFAKNPCPNTCLNVNCVFCPYCWCSRPFGRDYAALLLLSLMYIYGNMDRPEYHRQPCGGNIGFIKNMCESAILFYDTDMTQTRYVPMATGVIAEWAKNVKTAMNGPGHYSISPTDTWTTSDDKKSHHIDVLWTIVRIN